jgi:hypothetical protein
MTQAQIFQLICIALPFVLGGILVPLVAHIIGNLPAAKQSKIMAQINKAVQSVEQVTTANTANATSANKKALALQFASTLLKDIGVTLDTNVLSMLIESAVYVINQTQASTISTPTVQATTTIEPTTSVQPSVIPMPSTQSVQAPMVRVAPSSAYDVSQFASQTGIMPTV